jgi:DNA-binding transcriptional LysR family regulator
MVLDGCKAAGAPLRRAGLCNSLAVLGTMVRKGVGIAPLPVELFTEELAAGMLMALPGRPSMRAIGYSAFYLPAGNAGLTQEIAALAQAESWFAAAGRETGQAPGAE